MSIRSGLWFGYSSLDKLINPQEMQYCFGDDTPDSPSGHSTISCIAGPDGVGKSILSLAAASTYAASSWRESGELVPKIIYASTDLNYEQALSTWKKFGLHNPAERRKLLRERLEEIYLPESLIPKVQERDELLASEECDLAWVCPFVDPQKKHTHKDVESYSTIFDETSKSPRVNFLDLAEFSAGDDWGLLNRTVGLLRNVQDNPSSPHLIILDAVEGLEAMVGEQDSFGLKRSRRSRLAQLVRISRKANCNIIFVVEQERQDLHLDEVFVSDLVIRLRSHQTDGYSQKTIEIEKARSTAHVRGEHELQIRDGKGASIINAPDDPVLPLGDSELGYILVLPSLHVKPEEPVLQKACAIESPRHWFDIDDLDHMLSEHATQGSIDARDRVVVSVGEPGTLKSRLGYAFLAAGFASVPEATPENNGAILISTEGIYYGQVKQAFEDWNRELSSDNQLLVRHILPRFLSSSGLLFRLKCCIRHMKRELNIKGHEEAKRIRLVIDNWTTILNTHPSLRNDPLILQAVFRLLLEEGVLAHIIASRPGSPNTGKDFNRPHDLLNLETRKIHTWPVDFFGGRRIAITTSMSSFSGKQTLVYELLRDKGNFGLKTNSHFGLYEQLESGQAKRVDLIIRLYSSYDEKAHEDLNVSSRGYTSEVSALFGDLFPHSTANKEVVQFEGHEGYSNFKEYIQSIGGSQLSETLVFQLDEFWGSVPNQGDSQMLADLPRLTSKLVDGSKNPILEEYNISEANPCRRIPLHKDLGFLLADRTAWAMAKDIKLQSLICYKLKDYKGLAAPIHTSDFGVYPKHPHNSKDTYNSYEELTPDESTTQFLTVGDVWDSLCLDCDRFLPIGNSLLLLQPSWELFLRACEVVAKVNARLPFDIDFLTTETLNSLVLEIWYSKIDDYVSGRTDSFNECTEAQKEKSRNLFSRLNENEGYPGLSELLDVFGELFIESVQMLFNYLPSKYRKVDLRLGHASHDAVAFRTWYATGVLAQQNSQHLAALRLPGRYYTRGDWYLGVISGSRSPSLGEEAIERLVSTNMNINRLREGIGLPVRDLGGLSHLLTALKSPVREDSNVEYGDLQDLELGLTKSKLDYLSSLGSTPKDLMDNDSFKPLHRSRISGYSEIGNELYRFIAFLLREMGFEYEEESQPISKELKKHFEEFREFSRLQEPTK